MKTIITSICLLFATASFAQNGLYISFIPKVGGQDLVLNTNVQNLGNVTMSITDFQYYITNLEVIHDGGQSLDLSDTTLFVQTAGENFNFYLGQHDVTTVEQVNFGVGVPQAINHLDITLYPTGHPLSWQTPSMHWGWTSGYKFMLIDGYGDGTGDGNPESIFQLHNLGDANYKNVQLPVAAHNDAGMVSIVINCNADEWIYSANPGTVGVQHNTTGINATVMNNVNDRNVFEAPADAGIEEVNIGDVSFNIENDLININWNDVVGANSASIYDASGKEIKQFNELSNNGSVQVSNLGAGTYFFFIKSKENITLNNVQFFQN